MTPFPALLLVKRIMRVRKGLDIPTFKSWLAFSSEQPLSRGYPGAHPELPLEQKTLQSLGKLQEFQKPCVRNWGQRSNIKTKDAPSVLVFLLFNKLQEF